MKIRSKWIFSVLAVAMISATCSDDPADESGEPDVATMRIVVGAQTVNVNALNGTVTGGPIVLAANTDVPVMATFLRADGSADPLVTATTFRLEAVPATGSNITFTRLTPFSGTLRGTVAGTQTIEFGLFHLMEGHNEFEFNVPITVQ